MADKKKVLTPPIDLLETLPHGLGYILQLPNVGQASHHYGIVQANTLPTHLVRALGLPEAFPRVYYVCNVENSPANHAHRNGTGVELMLVLAGQAKVRLWNPSGEFTDVPLAPAEPGERFEMLVVLSGVWHYLQYVPGTILAVHATVNYDREAHYIEEPEAFFVDKVAFKDYRDSIPT